MDWHALGTQPVRCRIQQQTAGFGVVGTFVIAKQPHRLAPVIVGQGIHKGSDAPNHLAIVLQQEEGVAGVVEGRVADRVKLAVDFIPQGRHPDRVMAIETVGQVHEDLQIGRGGDGADIHEILLD